MSSHKVEEKELLDRFGPRISSLPVAPSPPGFSLAGYFFAFVLGGMGVVNSGTPSEYNLKLFLVWVLPCFLLAAFGGVKLYRELWGTNWTPDLRERGIALWRAKTWAKTFGFDEVKEISIRERDLFEKQEFYGRQWDVRLRSDKDRVTFRLRTLDGQPDEAGALLDELRAGLAEMTERRLRQGEALVGEGWRLTNAVFKAGSLEVPFSEVAGAGLFGGGRVALWKIGEESPFFTVPARSTNVMVLHDVLAARLPSHALGLGRLQFEKRSHWLPAVPVGLVAAACFYAAYLLRSEDAGFPPIAFAGLATGGLFALGAYALAARGFRCYERGLVKHSILGRREILFAEVGGLTFRSSWHDFKGIHLFTHLSLSLHRRQGGEPFRVSLVTRRKGDRDIEGLRDRLSEGLAGEVYDRLESEREIPWLNGVRLTRDGVLYPIPGRNPGVGDGYISYAQGVLHSFEGGDFFLYRKGDGKPALHLPATAPNFFPGFALLERLAAEANAVREARSRD